MKEKSKIDQKISVLRDYIADQSKSLKCRLSKAKVIKKAYRSSDPEIKNLALECWKEFDLFFLFREVKTKDFRKLINLACDILLFEIQEFATEKESQRSISYILRVKEWAEGRGGELRELAFAVSWREIYPYGSTLQGMLSAGCQYGFDGYLFLDNLGGICAYSHQGKSKRVEETKRKIFLEYFPTPDSK